KIGPGGEKGRKGPRPARQRAGRKGEGSNVGARIRRGLHRREAPAGQDVGGLAGSDDLLGRQAGGGGLRLGEKRGQRDGGQRGANEQKLFHLASSIGRPSLDRTRQPNNGNLIHVRNAFETGRNTGVLRCLVRRSGA